MRRRWRRWDSDGYRGGHALTRAIIYLLQRSFEGYHARLQANCYFFASRFAALEA